MKYIFSLFLILLSVIGLAQNIDSLLAEPQEMELSISTPQPRLNETFQISLDIKHLRGNIFKSLAGKVRLSNDINVTDEEQMRINVQAVSKGKYEIGPLEFYLNKTKYKTNKIHYEVVDPIPSVDSGLWIRKVAISESVFCIIIDQRIPAASKKTNPSDNMISFTTEPEHTNIFKFKESYSIQGLTGGGGSSVMNFSSVMVNGQQKQFMYSTSIQYFNILDKNAKIRISKDVFMNLPAGYDFKDIEVQ